MPVRVQISASIKDHPAPAYGLWNGDEVPGILLLDPKGGVTIHAGKSPSKRFSGGFKRCAQFRVPARIRGAKLYELLVGPGRHLLRQILEALTVERAGDQTEMGEVYVQVATDRLQEMLSSLDEENCVHVVPPHAMREALFYPLGLHDIWPGGEPLDRAVIRLKRELENLWKLTDVWFADLTEANLRTALIEEVQAMKAAGRRIGEQHRVAVEATA